MQRATFRILLVIASLGLAGSARAQDSWTKIPGLVGGDILSITSTRDGKYWASSLTGLATSELLGQDWSEIGTLGDNAYSLTQTTSGKLMATRNCRVYESEDGGSSWSDNTPPDGFSSSCEYGGFLASSPALGVVAAVSSYAAAVSFTDGSTWIVRTATDTSFARVRPAIAANGDVLFPHWSTGKILKSTNVGSAWMTVSTGLSEGSQIWGLYVASTGRIWLSGIEDNSTFVLLHSDDNGATWSRRTPALFSATIISSFAEFQGDLIVGSGLGFHRSSDNGDTWTEMNGGLGDVQGTCCGWNWVADLHASSSGLAAVYNSSSYRYDAGTSTWIRWMDGIERERITRLYIDSAEAVWGASPVAFTHRYEGGSWTTSHAAGLAGFFERSDGEIFGVGGRLWRWDASSSSWYTLGSGSRNLQAITESPDGILYGLGGSGLAASTDGGFTWTTLTSAYAQAAFSRIYSFYPNHVLMSTAQAIVQSQDGGTTWESVFSAPATAFIYAFLAVHDDRGQGVLVVSYANPNETWRSTDGGTSWTKSSSAGGRFFNEFVALPGGAICGSADWPDVFCSFDAGLTWEASGLANQVTALGAGQDNTLYVSPNSDGIWSKTIRSATVDLIPPRPPRMLAATQTSETMVSVSWGSSRSVDGNGYVLYKGTASFPTSQLAILPSGTTAFVDTNASLGATYFYIVKAVDASGNLSKASTQVSITIQDSTPPAAPAGLSAVGSDGLVTVTWTANTETDILAYRVFKGTAPNPTALAGAVLAGTTVFPDAGLTNGTAYYYRLTAVDQSGNESAFSTDVQATPTQAADTQAPAAPLDLSANAGDAEVSLTWTANTESDLASYRLYRGPTPSPTTLLTTIAAGTAAHTDAGLTNGTAYYYRLTAVDQSGNESAFSTDVQATPTQAADTQAPAAPLDLSANAGDAEVSLTWTANTESDLASYRLYRGPTPSPTTLLTTVAVGTTGHTDTGLSNGTAYYYRLTAVDQSGNESAFSTDVQATPTQAADTQAPAAPLDLSANAGDAEVSLTWTANQESDLAEYGLYRGTTSGSLSARASVQAGTLEFVDSGLANGTTYVYQLTAKDNSSNESPLSAEVSATPVAAVFPVIRTQSFGSASRTSDFRMISLPGSGSVSMSTTFSGTAGTDWNAFRDTGASSSDASVYLQAYDGSSNFDFVPGRGFWAVSTNGWQVSSRDVEQVRLAGDGTYSVSLHDGWNVIGNPFDIAVAWSDVQAANGGISESLDSYSGTHSTAATMQPYVGYYFNNPGLSSLKIPYLRAGAGKQIPEPAAARVTFSRRELESTVAIAFDDAARAGRDALDRASPPSNFAVVHAAIVLDEGTNLRHDVRPNIQPASYELVVTAEEPGEITITSDTPVWLISGNGSRTLAISSEPTGVPIVTRSRYTLVYGTRAEAEVVRASIVPDQLTLEAAFPNPFDQMTTVEYALPEDGLVQVEVFDILGRHIAILDSRNRTAGRYASVWDGSRYPSGVYWITVRFAGSAKAQAVLLTR
jgi:fibronectin type 3 domain-containing protein